MIYYLFYRNYFTGGCKLLAFDCERLGKRYCEISGIVKNAELCSVPTPTGLMSK